LNYIYTDKDGKVSILPVKAIRAEDYTAFYAQGARGGFTLNYHFRLDLFQDEMPPVSYSEVGGSVVFGPEEAVVRTIKASVFLSLPALKLMSEWLARQIEAHEAQYGPIQMPIPATMGAPNPLTPPQQGNP
jgi:hypothetical protein